MKLAFCLFRYFPFGGLQRDFMRIAEEAHRRGHDITVFTMQWDGDKPDWMKINILPTRSFTNHDRAWHFSHAVFEKTKEAGFDKIIGFNKMHGLDIYYAADTCFIAKEKYRLSPWNKLTRRYRIYARLEKAVLAPQHKTDVLLISPAELKIYQDFYATPNERLHLLPPGISKDRIGKANDQEARRKIREQLEIPEDDFVVLEIGSSFNTKGVDRSLQALANLPFYLHIKTHLVIAGMDKRLQTYRKLAEQLNLNNVYFLGPRTDVPDLLAAADLLIHPARLENTGTALLEALVAGVPVLTTDNCGYSSYIKESGGGVSLAIPFVQEDINTQLLLMLDRAKLEQFKINALNYAKSADLFSLIDRTVDFIER
jgi:UDP-glucose:(heptosyl)LPS alpha-1,3-glucosyltransferase